ncbi:MAG: Mu transposase C-terminal domain-containing protein [Nitrospiraceae bacterium]
MKTDTWEMERPINRQREDGSVQMIRPVFLREDGLAVGIIDIADHTAEPEWIARVLLEEELASGDAQLCDKDPYAFLRDPKYDDLGHPLAHRYEKYRQRRDRNFEIIEPLVTDPRIFHRKGRGKLIGKRAAQCHITTKHLRTLLRRYFQRGGMKNALLPDFETSGPGKQIRGPRQHFLGNRGKKLVRVFTDKRGVEQTVTGLYALFAQYLEDYFDKKGWSLSETLDALHAKVFNCGFEIMDGTKVPILKPVDERPNLDHLKHFYRRYWNKDMSRRKRLGEVGYGTTSRPRNKGTRHMAKCPGQLVQADGTSPDIIITGSIRRTEINGRATIYFLIDHLTHLICGFFISVRSECYVSVMMAIDHMSANKVEYCKSMGITIEASEWPVAHVPRQILVDNGVLRQWKGSHLVNALGIRVMNTSAYRGDLKALVERLNLTIKARICRMPGTTVQGKAGKRRRAGREAAATLEDLIKHVIAETLCHNNTTITEYTRTKDMIRDGVAPIPSQLWAWACRRLGKPRWLPKETLRLNLLPIVQGTVTPEGLVVKGCLYTCPDHLCAQARQDGRFKVFANYDPRAPDEVFMRDPDHDLKVIACVMQDEAMRGLDSSEIESLMAEDKNVRKQWEAHDDKQRATRNARQAAINKSAKKLHAQALEKQGVRHNDEKHVFEGRKEAIELENQLGAWRSGEVEETSKAKVSRTSNDSPDVPPPSNKFLDALRKAQSRT